MNALPKQILNRANKNVETAFNNIAGKLLFFPYLRPFSYWDNYYGYNPDIPSDFFQLLDYPTIQRFDNKGRIAKKAAELGFHQLFPASYFSVEEALQASEKDADSATKIWFIKPNFSTGGKGIVCLTTEQLADYELPRNHIIQEQVTDIELVNERKYTARAYLFVHQHKLYLFDDGFVMIHALPYQEHSTDFATQVEHRGYTKKDAAVKMLRMKELPAYEKKHAALTAAMQQLKYVLEEFILASSDVEYGLIGVDLLFQTDHTPKLIELNTKANFVHTQAINYTLNIPFFEAVLSTLYTGSVDARLRKI